MKTDNKETPAEDLSANSVLSGGGSVLLVDDNEELLNSLSLVLENAGLEVAKATSAVDALSLLESNTPDLIVSDVKMKGMDGYEFQEKVLANKELCQLPFIFLTALSDPEEVRKGKSCGCDDYLIKPFHPDDLIAVVEGKLNSYRIRKNFSEENLDHQLKGIIGKLSHEFRTPLVAINTGSELLKMKLEMVEEDALVKLSDSIHRGGLRLQNLFEDFSTLQRIQSGCAARTFESNATSGNIAKTLLSTLNRLSEIEFSDSKFEIDIKKEFFESKFNIKILEVQFEDAIKRLIENSVKFAGKEKPIEISLEVRKENTVSILVRDFGPGFEDSETRNALQLFGQIQRDKNEQQGCGLGITIANFYVENHGGEIIFNKPKPKKSKYPSSKSDDSKNGGLEVELRFSLKK